MKVSDGWCQVSEVDTSVFLDQWLPRWAAACPNRPALLAPGRVLTWRELHAVAQASVDRLTNSGVSKGDRVGIALPNGAEFAAALHACILLGAVAVPIDTRLGESDRRPQEREVDFLVDESDEDFAPASDHNVVDAGAELSAADELGDIAVEAYQPGYDDIAVIVHTSGTTAEARPIELTYGNIHASALGCAVALGHSRNERWLCPLPTTHIGGLMVLMRSLIYGTTAVLSEEKFDAHRLNQALHNQRITIVSLVPTMLKRMLEADLTKPKFLRCVLIGGGPIDQALLKKAKQQADIEVVQTYGLTEACSQVAVSVPGTSRAGLPLPGVKLRIADDGEILVAGPTVSPSAISDDGFLHTGDIGELTDAGLVVQGRKADTIITGGENVAPQEIEHVLETHPAITEAGVFGRADSEWGEAIHAKVVVAPGEELDVKELQNYSAEQLANYKVPKKIETVSSLPRTRLGKILRKALR